VALRIRRDPFEVKILESVRELLDRKAVYEQQKREAELRLEEIEAEIRALKLTLDAYRKRKGMK